MKDLSRIIKEFEKLNHKGYVQKRHKHETTDSYFYIARQLAKYTMRADAFNLDIDPVRTKMIGTQQIMISHDCDLEKSESKGILADENLLQVCSADKSKSKSVNADESSTKESESECVHQNINKLKDAKNEAEHEETLVTDNPVVKETICFNIFECGNNLLNKLDATYERSCMATPRDKYYTKMYETLVDYNDRNDAPLSNENI